MCTAWCQRPAEVRWRDSPVVTSSSLLQLGLPLRQAAAFIQKAAIAAHESPVGGGVEVGVGSQTLLPNWCLILF